MNGTVRHVLVTGAHQGIGRACAIRFGASGANVVCADIRPPDNTVAEVIAAGGTATAHICDVADEASVRALLSALPAPPEILVHAAGVILERGLLEMTAADFDRVISVNLRGTFLIGRETIRRMSGRKGRVILIASDMAYAGRECFSAYVASKHGVLGLMRSWAKEFAPDILVNAICPGPIDTEMLGAAAMSPEWRARARYSSRPVRPAGGSRTNGVLFGRPQYELCHGSGVRHQRRERHAMIITAVTAS